MFVFANKNNCRVPIFSSFMFFNSVRNDLAFAYIHRRLARGCIGTCKNIYAGIFKLRSCEKRI